MSAQAFMNHRCSARAMASNAPAMTTWAAKKPIHHTALMYCVVIRVQHAPTPYVVEVTRALQRCATMGLSHSLRRHVKANHCVNEARPRRQENIRCKCQVNRTNDVQQSCRYCTTYLSNWRRQTCRIEATTTLAQRTL